MNQLTLHNLQNIQNKMVLDKLLHNILLKPLMLVLVQGKQQSLALSKTFPKIDLFTWTLLHGKILTGDNLEKRGFMGPFHFPLCSAANE